jgi:glycosyltransferase involved in cell wall biosynthesis
MEPAAEPLVSLVVPVYREEPSIAPFLARALPILERLAPFEIIFCLDPSLDRTEAAIHEAIKADRRIGLLRFSRRVGQPAATMAGILNCRGRWCIIIDVDLQDPPELIELLYRKAIEGFDVVTARRIHRRGETLAKRVTSRLWYALIDRIADVSIPRDTGDFRIISRRVIEELRGLRESHGFLRGLVALVGFPQADIGYERAARHAGGGNYNRHFGSFKIGFNGIFGFSTVPLQLMLWSGFILSIVSAIAIFVVIALKILNPDLYPGGVPTLTILVLFLGGIQLAGLGVLGEYIGRVYDEVRHRPLYIIESAINVAVRDARGPRSGPPKPYDP